MIHTNVIYSRNRVAFRIDCNMLQLVEAHIAKRFFKINDQTDVPIQLLQIDEEELPILYLISGLYAMRGKYMYFDSVNPLTLKIQKTGVHPYAFVDIMKSIPFKYIANKKYSFKFK